MWERLILLAFVFKNGSGFIKYAFYPVKSQAIAQKNDIYHFFIRSYWTNGSAIGVLDTDTDLVSFLM